MKPCILILSMALLLGGCGEGPDQEAAPAAAADESSIDVAQEAQRIDNGMTEQQVVKILGEPRTRVRESEGERLTFWTFGADQKIKARVYVTLDAEGKVVNVETIPL